jgi:hypothetical protein
MVIAIVDLQVICGTEGGGWRARALASRPRLPGRSTKQEDAPKNEGRSWNRPAPMAATTSVKDRGVSAEGNNARRRREPPPAAVVEQNAMIRCKRP